MAGFGILIAFFGTALALGICTGKEQGWHFPKLGEKQASLGTILREMSTGAAGIDF